MKFYNVWRTHSWVHSGHNRSCTSIEACVIPLPETFYFNDVLQNLNTDFYCRMEQGWTIWLLLLQPSINGVAVSQICLCQGSRWTFSIHFVISSWFSVLS